MATFERLESGSDFRFPRVSSEYYAELMRKADTCAAALLEARRLGGAAMFDSLYGQLSGRVRDLLDELDELLLYLDHRSDRRSLRAYGCAAFRV